MVAHAVRQTMRDDDLHGPIDSGLRVVALDVAILGLQDAALRIGEVALRLAGGLRFGGAGVLPLFFRSSARRFCSACLRRRSSSSAAALASASSAAWLAGSSPTASACP